jgi:hypothetical protein
MYGCFLLLSFNHDILSVFTISQKPVKLMTVYYWLLIFSKMLIFFAKSLVSAKKAWFLPKKAWFFPELVQEKFFM